MLAVSRSMERERLHGRLTPVTRSPPGSATALIVGCRIPAPGRPSANPEASSRASVATLSMSSHSRPSPRSLSSTRLAMEKWCMVVATARG